MRIIGHRGCGAGRPENTAASLRHAVSLGLDGIEVDVWPTADCGFVLLHDADVSALTGEAGWPSHLPQAVLQQADVGARFGQGYVGERIISLEQALEIVDGKAELFLELKRTRHDEQALPWIEEHLADVLRTHEAMTWCTVISFDHRSLLALKGCAPSLRIGMVYAGEWLNLWSEIRELQPDVLLPHWAQTTESLVSQAHQTGLSVFSWVVNQPYVLERLAEVGVDGVITDYPERSAQQIRSQYNAIKEGENGRSIPGR